MTFKPSYSMETIPSGTWDIYNGEAFEDSKRAKQYAAKLFGFYKAIGVKPGKEGKFFIFVCKGVDYVR